MIKRGDFVEDVHFFRVGRRIVFKWYWPKVAAIDGSWTPPPVQLAK